MAPQHERPRVSILIVSWNTRDLTAQCLDSIGVGLDDDVTREVVVVDNGSTDGSVELLRSRPEVALIENGENRGFADAVNAAYRASSGELVLLLNSDIRFTPGSLSALVRFLDEHPDVAGVGPLYLNPDGSPQDHHYRLPTLAMLVAGTSRVFRLVPALARTEDRYRMIGEDFTRPRPVEQPSASVLLLRRSVLDDGYLLDPAFPIYFNDVELAHRLRARGQALWMTPDSRVYHEHGASTRLLGTALQRQHLASLVRYVDRTQPRGRRFVFKTCALLPRLAAMPLRRTGSLGPGELLAALRGDGGPLPGASTQRGR